jgi:hypothetical protein
MDLVISSCPFFSFSFTSDNNYHVYTLYFKQSCSFLQVYVTYVNPDHIEQICRCHGRPIDLANTNKAKWMCPITSRQLTASDVTDTAVKIGEQTVLFLPDSEGVSSLRRASSSISFDVIERTNLASLNEGLIIGTPHIVIPSSNDVEVALDDECSDQNTQRRSNGISAICLWLLKWS